MERLDAQGVATFVAMRPGRSTLCAQPCALNPVRQHGNCFKTPLGISTLYTSLGLWNYNLTIVRCFHECRFT